MPEVMVRLEQVEKSYPAGDSTIKALEPTTVDFHKAELTLIMGPSGSGKTTLLSILGCVIYPSAGKVYYGDKNVAELNPNQLAELRLQKIGFVFQQFNLIEPLSALENTMQPLLLQGVSRNQARQQAEAALREMGLADRIHNLPMKLSGGQKQRVAVARALVTEPELVLCDEPTASLDAKSAGMVMEELARLSKGGKAVVVVSHDLRLRKYADRVIYVEEGRVSNSISNEEDYR